jgi:hypothetical protein
MKHRSFRASGFVLTGLAAVCGCVAASLLESAYGKTLSVDALTLTAQPPCTYESNNAALRKIRRDARLPQVIAILDGALISFDLFSKTDQRIDPSELANLDYDALQPVTMILLAESPNKGLITEKELLLITFAQQELPLSAKCDKAYIGP